MAKARMTPDEILASLRQPQPLPKAALHAAAEQADAVVPRIADLMERAADPDRGVDPEDESIIFFGVFVIGETGDTRGYRPLLKFLAGDPEKVDRLLGDALTETMALVLTRIAEDPEPLINLVCNGDANEYARGAALYAWARRAAEIPLSDDDIRQSLATIYEHLRLDRDNYLAPEWCKAAACLGRADFRSQVEQILPSAQGALLPMYNMRWFDRDLERQEAEGSLFLMDARRWVSFEGTAVDELSRWHSFREETAQPSAKTLGGTRRNTYRDVGRNDPCPCGSGKKSKKCCGRT
jgi:hypothetical protein